MTIALEKKYQNATPVLEGTKIRGYASLFDYQDQQGDQVAQGAFKDTLAKRKVEDIKMLWQHDPAKPIGVWTKIQEDSNGLYVEGHILDAVEAGREALALLRAGAINGLSIGYRTLVSGKSNGSGRILRTIDLWEISLVTFPMLREARAEMAEAQAQQNSLRQLCEATRDLRKLINEE